MEKTPIWNKGNKRYFNFDSNILDIQEFQLLLSEII